MDGEDLRVLLLTLAPCAFGWRRTVRKWSDLQVRVHRGDTAGWAHRASLLKREV